MSGNSINAINGTNRNDRLLGTTKADHFYGGVGDDCFIGNGGQDTYEGGGGMDTVDYSWASSAVKVNLSMNGYKSVQNTGGGGWATFLNILGLKGTRFDDDLRGFLGNNVLDGGDGNDYIFGDAGDDTLIGGNGNDTLDGGTNNDDLRGDTGSDVLYGGLGDDRLDGGVNTDKLFGGAGKDVLLGGEGDDYLSGGSGADVINGGNGLDCASYEDADRSILLDLRDASGNSNRGDAIGDTFTNIENYRLSWNADTFWASNVGTTVYGCYGQDSLNGGAGNDTLYGDGDGVSPYGTEDNDVLNGGDGNDVLIGGFGADKVNGGAGYDVASYADAQEGITLNLRDSTGKSNRGDAKGDVFSDIEEYSLTNYADVFVSTDSATVIHGMGGDDKITTGAGADVLYGDGGNDTLNAGDGNDLLFGGAGADKVNGGAGYDVACYLDAQEGVTLNLRDSTGQSNSGDAKGDVFSSIEEFKLTNLADIFISTDSATVIHGMEGDDKITTGAGADILYGDSGSDTLNAGDGDDLLFGGIGRDFLYGGRGADKFAYSSLLESTPLEFDQILDFNREDRIDLSQIDANPFRLGDQAFTLRQSTTFSGGAGEAIFSSTNNITIMQLDISGDRIADFQLGLDGQINLFGLVIL